MQANPLVTAVARYDLAHLSDSDLLAGTRRLVGTSNQLFADLLAHLAEVESRGTHRTRACASLYTYCIYELRFSEDAAFRRVSAARLVKTFPALFDAIAAGELHLTGLLMLGPHLTQANHLEILARAKHRTKRELAALIRQIDPLPNVPARIEPLGATVESGSTPLRAPTWEQYVTSLNPVRHLAPGERPRDWIDETEVLAAGGDNDDEPALARCEHTLNDDEPALARCEHTLDDNDPALVRCAHTINDNELSVSDRGLLVQVAHRFDATAVSDNEPARNPRTLSWPIQGPQRYGVQFTANEEYVQLVERAKALLSQASQGCSVAELHLRAMRVLVAQLERRKYGTEGSAKASAEVVAEPAPTRGVAPAQTNEPQDQPEGEQTQQDSAGPDPRQRGRYIPAAVRGEVYRRDAARCTYLDSNGERCRETRGLELHHRQPFALLGAHSAENLTLHCRAHNGLCAEQDFGRTLIEHKRTEGRHDSMASQQRP